jgi:hypothetical protein
MKTFHFIVESRDRIIYTYNDILAGEPRIMAEIKHRTAADQIDGCCTGAL